MKRRLAKHLPKPVRLLRDALGRLGIACVTVETAKAGYRVSWTVSGIAMCIRMGLSGSANAFESAWQAIHRLFRQHRIMVPA